MTLLFGEFLVEKKVIAESVLLDALIEQLRAIPSTAEIIHSEKLMPTRDTLLVLSTQQRQGLDFKSAAKVLGIWNQDIENKVEACQKKHIPLGEILVKSGHIDLETLAKSLEAYTSQFSTQSAKSGNSPKQATPPGPNKLDPLLSKEFSELFESRMQPTLRDAATRFKEESADASSKAEAMRKAQSECVAVQAASSFLGAVLTERVARTGAAFLKRACETRFDEKKTALLLSLLLHILDAHNEIIKNFQAEPNLEADANLNDLHERFLKVVDEKQEQRRFG